MSAKGRLRKKTDWISDFNRVECLDANPSDENYRQNVHVGQGGAQARPTRYKLMRMLVANWKVITITEVTLVGSHKLYDLKTTANTDVPKAVNATPDVSSAGKQASVFSHGHEKSEDEKTPPPVQDWNNRPWLFRARIQQED